MSEVDRRPTKEDAHLCEEHTDENQQTTPIHDNWDGLTAYLFERRPIEEMTSAMTRGHDQADMSTADRRTPEDEPFLHAKVGDKTQRMQGVVEAYEQANPRPTALLQHQLRATRLPRRGLKTNEHLPALAQASKEEDVFEDPEIVAILGEEIQKIAGENSSAREGQSFEQPMQGLAVGHDQARGDGGGLLPASPRQAMLNWTALLCSDESQAAPPELTSLTSPKANTTVTPCRTLQAYAESQGDGVLSFDSKARDACIQSPSVNTTLPQCIDMRFEPESTYSPAPTAVIRLRLQPPASSP